MADTTSIISRSKLEFPNLSYTGGSALEDLVKGYLTKLGDNAGSRYDEYTSIANSTTVELDHNFGVAFAEIKINLYTGTGTNLTRVEDPSGSGWTIAAKTGSEKLIIEITTPSSGSPHNFSVVASCGGFIESLDELDDFDNTGVANGYIPIWNNSNSRYEPGVNTPDSWTSSVKTALYTASSKEEVFCNTSGGAFTVNLPATPSLGDRVRIIDSNGSFGSFTLTVGRNGSTIMGNSADFTFSTDNDGGEFIYNGSDWRLL
jgi:hypothetical protein